MRAIGSAGLLFSIGVAACLPLGEPPTGRHLLVTRDVDEVGFAEPAPGAPASIVMYRSALAEDVFTICASYSSLFAVDDPPAAGGLATERLLADQVERLGPIGQYGFIDRSYLAPSDLKGRVFVAWQPPTPGLLVDQSTICPPGNGRMARIDPATGQRTELGRLYMISPGGGALSPDRSRFVFTGVSGPQEALTTQVVVRDVEDRETTFAGTLPVFVGSDLFAIDADHALVKVGVDGQRRPLVSEVMYLSAYAMSPRPLLQLQRESGAQTLFDPVAEVELDVPAGSLSPSGRYIMQVTTDYVSETTLDLYDRDTGTKETRTFGRVQYYDWRPGTKDEFWIDSGDLDGKLARWTPGAPTVTVDVGRGYASFSGDGRYWLRVSGTNTEARSADDPGTPGFVLNPPGSRAGPIWMLTDGRLLVEADVGNTNRYDIFVVDPVGRMSHPIASGGNIVAVGRTRVLAFLKWVAGTHSGDLSLVDLETGATTLLAENAYGFAVEPAAPDADPLGAGLRVVALVRNRIASPFDGLWLSTLP